VCFRFAGVADTEASGVRGRFDALVGASTVAVDTAEYPAPDWRFVCVWTGGFDRVATAEAAVGGGNCVPVTKERYIWAPMIFFTSASLGEIARRMVVACASLARHALLFLMSPDFVTFQRIVRI
jgi:hypothetical protein